MPFLCALVAYNNCVCACSDSLYLFFCRVARKIKKDIITLHFSLLSDKHTNIDKYAIKIAPLYTLLRNAKGAIINQYYFFILKESFSVTMRLNSYLSS